MEKLKPRNLDELPQPDGLGYLEKKARMEPVSIVRIMMQQHGGLSDMASVESGKPVFRSKPIWASKTVWGVFFMLLGWLLKKQGVQVDLEPLKDFVNVTLEDGIFYLGVLLTALGRLTANARIVLWPTRNGEGKKEDSEGSSEGEQAGGRKQ
jgi:hypothetical protein